MAGMVGMLRQKKESHSLLDSEDVWKQKLFCSKQNLFRSLAGSGKASVAVTNDHDNDWPARPPVSSLFDCLSSPGQHNRTEAHRG